MKKKDKTPDDTPLENINYFSMNLKELKKFAIKVGNELDSTRRERLDFETDRDNMIHYWSNAVYELMQVERDIRRLEREEIHKKNALERSFVQKQYELVDARYDSMCKLVKVSEGSVMRTFDKIREVMKTEGHVFSDRLRLRNQYWTTNTESDVAIMKMKQRALCKELDNIFLAHKDAIMETVDERNKIFDSLYDRMEADAEEEFRNVILLKNKKIHDIRKKHENGIRDILKNFEYFRSNDLIIKYRKEISECKEDSAAIANKAEKASATYSRCLTSYKVVQEILQDLRKLKPSFNVLKENSQNLKEKLKDLDAAHRRLFLETDELEAILKRKRSIKKELWNECFSIISKARKKQIKIHLAVQTLTRMLSKELVSKEELLARYHKQKDRNFMPLVEAYDRFRACRLSLQEMLDRTLRACGSNLDSLGIIPPDHFLESPSKEIKLPPLLPLRMAPTGRPRLEWAYKDIRIKPALFRSRALSQDNTNFRKSSKISRY